MSAASIVAIGVVVLVLLAAVLLVATARRRDVTAATGFLARETRKRDRGAVDAAAPDGTAQTGRAVERAAALARTGAGTAIEPAPARPPAPWVPPDPEAVAVSRRAFFNRSAATLMGVSLGGFGMACIAFLWPSASGGFGSKITVGSLSDVKSLIRSNRGFLYVPEGRAWVTEYPTTAITKAEAAGYSAPVLEGMRNGLTALYQKCPHLGCRVPQCDTSQWFECPCHGSQYNRNGEKKGGPAPRGLDLFGVAVVGDQVVVDTGTIFQGAPIGVNTTGQEAEGPHCISSAGGH